jgi:hypothetical protein
MRSPSSRRLHGIAALAACLATSLSLDLATASAPDEDSVTTLPPFDWGTPVRMGAPSPLADHPGNGELRWHGREDAWQWSARVALGAASAVTPGPTLFGETQWLYGGWAGHAVRLGAQARRDLLLPQALGSAVGASLSDEWSLASAWRLALGLRSDTAPDTDTTVTPRIALSWQARGDLQLRLLDGVVWRDPAAAALTDAGAAPLRFGAGEQLHATELAVRWQALRSLRLAASLHQHRSSEAVDGVVTGALPAALQFDALGPSAPGEGLGLEGDLAGDEGWRLRVRWAAFQVRADDVAALPGAQRVLAALHASAPLPVRGASAALDLLHLQHRQGSAGIVPLSQTLINASLAWAPAGSPWSLATNAYNLADHAVVEGALLPQDALVREGRRWQLQVARAF